MAKINLEHTINILLRKIEKLGEEIEHESDPEKCFNLYHEQKGIKFALLLLGITDQKIPEEEKEDEWDGGMKKY